MTPFNSPAQMATGCGVLLAVVLRRVEGFSAGISSARHKHWWLLSRLPLPGDQLPRRQILPSSNSTHGHLAAIALSDNLMPSLQSRRRPAPVKTSNRCTASSALVLCVTPVIVICRSPVRAQHQRSTADLEIGNKTELTLKPSRVNFTDGGMIGWT